LYFHEEKVLLISFDANIPPYLVIPTV